MVWYNCTKYWIDMKGLHLKYIGLVILAYLHSGNSLTCLSCDFIAHPRLCTHVTKCFAGEKCGMDTFISQDGDVQYKLGCVDTNTCGVSPMNTITDGHQYFSCHQCCDDHDLCNVRGCNSTGFPTNRGPVCYNCEAFPEGYPCHKITHCETHEVCYNDAHLEFQSDVLYSSGCRSKHHCASENVDPMSGIGRRSVSVCTDCCQGDLCNLQCRNTSVCSDDSTCQLLMSNYDVCKSPDIAKQFCKKSCNLCATSGMPSCTDTRLDCAYISTAANVCGTLQAARTYGCLKYCGYCSGSTRIPGSMNTGYKTTTSTIKNNVGSTNTGYETTTSTIKNNVGSTNTGYETTTSTIKNNVGSTNTGYEKTTSTIKNNADYSTSPQGMAFSTTTSTLSTGSSSTIAITTPAPLQGGAHVVRGPDWHYGNQDGNSTGTVIGASLGTGWVHVYWYSSNTTQSYRYGDNGLYEVQEYRGPLPSTQQTTVTRPPFTFAPSSVQVTTVNFLNSTQTTQLFVGDKVVRGPDWRWQSQDGNGTGTVITAPVRGWVTIKWNKTGQENSYRYGSSGKYDVKLYSRGGNSTINYTTTGRPTSLPTTVTTYATTQARTLSVGDHVIPGPDWKWKDQDGNTTGVVTGASVPGWVTVRWGNGFENSYRYVAGGAHDVEPVNLGYTPGAPSGTASSGTVSVGDMVIRGPDWKYANQDGNGTGYVTEVVSQSKGTWVKVQWKSGYQNFYRYGAEGKYDVMKVATGTTLTKLPASEKTSTILPATTVSIWHFKVGDRVVRGPDWQWADQDNGGVGTVTGVDTAGWVTVRWSNNFENSYRNGVQGAHDLQKVGSTAATTTTQSQQIVSAPPTAGSGLVNAMYIGARVQRGKDWRYGSQDGNGSGTVRALPPTVPSGWVQVEWDNGYINNYRLGNDSSYDIMFVPGSYSPSASG